MAPKHYISAAAAAGVVMILVTLAFTWFLCTPSSITPPPPRFNPKSSAATTNAQVRRMVNLSDFTYDPAQELIMERDVQRIMWMLELEIKIELNEILKSRSEEEIVYKQQESSSPGVEIEGCLMCKVKDYIGPKKFVLKTFGKSYDLNFYLKSCPESECKDVYYHEKDCCEIVVDKICDHWMRRTKGWRVHVPLDAVTQRVYENNKDLIQNYCNSRVYHKSVRACLKSARLSKYEKPLENCYSITPLFEMDH